MTSFDNDGGRDEATAASGAKLLFLVEHFRESGEGAENDAVRLCRALAERGWEVHVAARDADMFPGITVRRGALADPGETMLQAAPDLTIDWGLFHPADVHRVGGGLQGVFRRYSLNSYTGLGRLFKQLRGLAGADAAMVAHEAELLANPAAHFLAISDFIRQQLVDHGARPEAVETLYNAVEVQRYDPAALAAARTEMRRQWGLAPEHVAFLFVAHNLRLKNLALLRRVFDRLARRHPEARLVVVGKRRPRFQAPYLVYAGHCSRMPSAYSAADGLLHPSHYDGFGNVVLEAMSCALPVVVSDCSGVSELVATGRNGIVLPVAGADAAAQWEEQVESLIVERERAGELGRQARQTALGHDFGSFVDAFEGVLTRLLAARRG